MTTSIERTPTGIVVTGIHVNPTRAITPAEADLIREVGRDIAVSVFTSAYQAGYEDAKRDLVATAAAMVEAATAELADAGPAYAQFRRMAEAARPRKVELQYDPDGRIAGYTERTTSDVELVALPKS